MGRRCGLMELLLKRSAQQGKGGKESLAVFLANAVLYRGGAGRLWSRGVRDTGCVVGQRGSDEAPVQLEFLILDEQAIESS